MSFSTHQIIRAAAVLGLAAVPVQALAQSFERPPSFAVDKIAGVWPSGENYTIVNPVGSDGLLRIYRLTTPYGEIVVQGDQMLRMRLAELAALAQLEKIASSESYSKALVAAGLSPIQYTGRLITSPVKTVGDTFQGLGNIFGRVQSGVANLGKAPGGGLAGLLGVSDQRRKLAATLGVDPYTDLAPLDERLSRLSEAAAAGGLTVQAAMLAVPGTAIGLAVSNVSTASTIEGMRIDELARDRTAAQIFDLNRERLRAMGAEEPSGARRGAGAVRPAGRLSVQYHAGPQAGRHHAHRYPGLDGTDGGLDAGNRGRCPQVRPRWPGRAPHHRGGDATGQKGASGGGLAGCGTRQVLGPAIAVAGRFNRLLYAP
jgi:hypothetical protein